MLAPERVLPGSVYSVQILCIEPVERVLASGAVVLPQVHGGPSGVGTLEAAVSPGSTEGILQLEKGHAPLLQSECVWVCVWVCVWECVCVCVGECVSVCVCV